MLHDRHDHDAWGVNFTAMTPSHFVLVNQSCFGTDRGPWAGASVILPLTLAWADDVALNFCANLNTHAEYTLRKKNLIMA
jgi:hypothetical protein